MAGCPKKPLGSNQTQSVSQAKGNEVEKTMHAWKFDQDAARRALCEVIIIDELSFNFVENEGFERFIEVICSQFKIPSKFIEGRDFFGRYMDIRTNFSKEMKLSDFRILLTTDTWTSNQNVCYMVMTGHYINENWRLVKKIMSFTTISSHKGEAIRKELEACLREWEIEKIFSVTVDNAIVNDGLIGHLKKKLTSWNQLLVKGKYLHVRCVAHILNLIVNDGLKYASVLIDRLRDVVKYVRGSTPRIEKFQEYADVEKVKCRRTLSLDVSTRWNSTYLMLATALEYQKDFDLLSEKDTTYFNEIEVKGRGMQNEDDWEGCRYLVEFLKGFYNLILKVDEDLNQQNYSLRRMF